MPLAVYRRVEDLQAQQGDSWQPGTVSPMDKAAGGDVSCSWASRELSSKR